MIADDEAAIRESLERVLQVEGYDTSTVANGLAVLDGVGGAGGDTLDLLILDVMMPRLGGLETCRRLRAAGRDLPVLMLTARDQVSDRVTGLDAGADDYLPKPFEPRELLARLKAILRRSKADRKSEVLRFGRLEVDRDAREVRLDGEARQLTSYQFDVLLVLAEHAGRVMSRDVLMDLLKAQPLEAFDRSIDVHISRIRAAIEDDPRKPRRIITVRNAGYVFAKAQD